ncbi:nucleotide-diphospho-sugar transferase [Fusarium redolens]|uniref:Nucleotide-diphospho-sugar transferase n=1 Tax=Fusarium redolens TaxID=48865 RepID=A0A9P9FYK4_FUSRE|nr:nucleotide-diphospho-sugar transferase [Fusarium redolens]KAH7207776.1 nucleotide-diphospho-sugar transferase [Fusarium redolens]
MPAYSKQPYDEERLEWATSVLNKYLRLPRFSRAAMILLFIDILIVAALVNAFEPLITLLRRNEELFGARLTLPLNDNSFAPTLPEQQIIPRIFHQTSANETVPEVWTDLVQSCRNTYSDFEYKHWTDDRARVFISEKYPWFLNTWDTFPFNIQRADAIRYFVLHHYGGIYLDMDTLCNKTIPLHQVEASGAMHHAVFKSTTPTGISNDMIIASPHHPAFTKALSRIQIYTNLTRHWARLLPHVAVMVSAGPLFLTMALKNYLLEQPFLPEQTVQIINATELEPYLTDFEGASWHHGDTKTLMWIGDRPWVWFMLGAIGLGAGLYVVNQLMLKCLSRFSEKLYASNDAKEATKLM